jgi:hypothetical protein
MKGSVILLRDEHYCYFWLGSLSPQHGAFWGVVLDGLQMWRIAVNVLINLWGSSRAWMNK